MKQSIGRKMATYRNKSYNSNVKLPQIINMIDKSPYIKQRDERSPASINLETMKIVPTNRYRRIDEVKESSAQFRIKHAEIVGD